MLVLNYAINVKVSANDQIWYKSKISFFRAKDRKSLKRDRIEITYVIPEKSLKLVGILLEK